MCTKTKLKEGDSKNVMPAEVELHACDLFMHVYAPLPVYTAMHVHMHGQTDTQTHMHTHTQTTSRTCIT